MTKPDWNAYHRLGAPIVAKADARMTFDEIAKEMGLKDRAAARHLCCVAMGKLVYAARKNNKENV